MLKITGIGHQNIIKKNKIENNNQSMLIYRKWRLGDIIMCEPVNRYWSQNGYNVSFCSFAQYHPIIKSFYNIKPKTISYNMNKTGEFLPSGYQYNIEHNLDIVGLLHEGHVSKVEAFLSAANIDYNNIDPEYKIPKLQVNTFNQSWAKTMLKDNGNLQDCPLIAIIRQSFSMQSPRSIPLHILDELYKLLSKDFHVLVLGEKPLSISVVKNIHNFTGCTPDIMSVAGLLEQCKLLVTADTGLMHLAGSIGVPMVSILGPTRPEDISLFYEHNTIIDAGRECSPCFDRGCDKRCLEEIDANFIYNHIIDRINAPFIDTMIIKSR